jgi:hypothetical protein
VGVVPLLLLLWGKGAIFAAAAAAAASPLEEQPVTVTPVSFPCCLQSLFFLFAFAPTNAAESLAINRQTRIPMPISRNDRNLCRWNTTADFSIVILSILLPFFHVGCFQLRFSLESNRGFLGVTGE